MEDFIVHLHLYLTNKESEDTAYENLKTLKEYGFKILITSPKPLPEQLYQYIDYFWYDTENQLLTDEYEHIEPTVLWLKTDDVELRFITVNPQRHGLAVLRAMINGSKLALAYGFTHIVRFEYDDLFGKESMKLIEDTVKRMIENKYDFYVYKNDYVGTRDDISVHLMYYKCDKFLEVFGDVKDERTYNDYLVKLNQDKQALILEQFLLFALEQRGMTTRVFYDTGENLTTLYHDTVFNKHQSDPGLKDGVLSDVLILKTREEIIRNQVYLAAQNFSSNDVQKIYFDIFDINGTFIHTYLFELDKRYWQYVPLILENIKTIKIKHNDSDHHKVVEIDPITGEISLFENDVRQQLLSEAILLK